MAGTKVKTEDGKDIQQKNIDAVGALRGQLESYKDIIFADYRGLTVAQMTDLRTRLREKKAVFKVVKNSFAKIALSQLKRGDASEYLTGPTAFTLAAEESASVAKMLFDFARESPLKIKGGLIEDGVFNGDQVEAYSKLPGRRELLAMLMGTMNAPVQNLVFAINGVTQKLVRTLAAIAEQKARN
jgi:large subunit ribosomal protein L10